MVAGQGAGSRLVEDRPALAPRPVLHRRQPLDHGDCGVARRMGVLNAVSKELIVHTSRTKKSADFVASLALIDRRWGPAPGRDTKPVRLVLDNGPVHTSKLGRAALAERVWIEVEWLPHMPPNSTTSNAVGGT